jgi:hypothetical protein
MIEAKLEDIVDNLFSAYFWLKYSVIPDPKVSLEDKIRLQEEYMQLKKKWAKCKVNIVEWKDKRTGKIREFYEIVERVVDGKEVGIWIEKGLPESEELIKELRDEGVIE